MHFTVPGDVLKEPHLALQYSVRVELRVNCYCARKQLLFTWGQLFLFFNSFFSLSLPVMSVMVYWALETKCSSFGSLAHF